MEHLTSTEMILWGCALGGSLFFLLRIALLLVGIGADDLHVDAHDADMSDHGGHETEAALKLFSLTSIAAFIMMFGWTGLTCLIEFEVGIATSVLIAVIVGTLTMIATAYVFSLTRKLTSEGADFKLSDAIGLVGKVYQEIPPDGQGKIQIPVNGMVRELDAESEETEKIDSFSTVTVTGTVSPTVVSVKKNVPTT